MTDVTRKAIVALLAVDETASVEERDRVAAALAGTVRVMSIAEAAKRLGVTRPTVYAYIQSGLLARSKSGMIAETEIVRFANAQQERRVG
jgi:predicted transcriptional regulator